MNRKPHLLLGLMLGLAASVGIGLASAQDATVSVELNEWSLIPSASSVSTGDILFVAANTGVIQHELAVVRTDLAPDALPVVDGIVDEQAVGLEGRIQPFAGGTTESGTFALAPGSYVLICNIPGHYQVGMYAGFSVIEAAAPTAEATATSPGALEPTGTPAVAPEPTGTPAAVQEPAAPAVELPATGSGGPVSDSSGRLSTRAQVVLLSVLGWAALLTGGGWASRTIQRSRRSS